jgi:hypothetical protein
MKLKLLIFGAIIMLATSCKKSVEDVLPETQTSLTAVSQATVPQSVTNTFASRFSGATQVEWFSTSSSSNSQRKAYEVEFNHSSQRHSAGYEDNGTERHHSISCLTAPVPQVVLTAFRSTHPTDLVYEWKLRNDGTWKAHFMRGTVKWEATYTAVGVLVKEEIA